MKEGIGDSFVICPENSIANTVCIEITKGKYEGVKYHYITASFVDSLGQPTLRFSYELDEVPPNLTLDDLEEFEVLLGDIIVYQVLSSKQKDERREDNS